MFNITVPDTICVSLHHRYDGDAPKPVKDHIRNAVKAMIASAVEDGIDPLPVPREVEAGTSFTISFPASIDRVLRQKSRASGKSIAQVALGYLYAAHARGDAVKYLEEAKSAEKESALGRYVAAVGLSPRTHQSMFFDNLMESLQAGKIGLVEGATGLGKTLAIVGAAAEAICKLCARRVVVTTPTLMLLRAFARQHRELAERLEGFPEMRIVIGRTEFVSVNDLVALLDDDKVECDRDAIRKWLDAGGPPVGDIAGTFGMNYLIASLEAISPWIGAEAVHLDDDPDEDDPGMIAYRSQFAADDETATEIIYCSHAMLAVEIRRRLAQLHASFDGQALLEEEKAFWSSVEKMTAVERSTIDDAVSSFVRRQAEIAIDQGMGRLPPWQYLIIDEAHVFEQNMAGVLSADISIVSYMRRLRRLCDEGSISGASMKAAQEAVRDLINLAPRDRDDGIDLSSGDRSSVLAHALLSELASIPCKSRKKDASDAMSKALRIAREIKSALQTATKGARGFIVWLEYSPVRSFPRLVCGRERIDRELRFLWSSCKAAACTSATLYLRRADIDSAGYMASILGIPHDRLMEFQPIKPDWIHEPVIGLWKPEKCMIGERLWLSPPSRADRLDHAEYLRRETAWHDEVADAIAQIAADSAGGVLVLLTSYDSVQAIAGRLKGMKERLLVASRDVTLNQQRRQFIEMAAQGFRPVWLALGGAWTGLDINGAEIGLAPDKDNLLTDLVIPRFPFGLNRSLTHMRRVEMSSHISWELLDTAMRFRQGIGRLVRREGLPRTRRIFVLDARVHDEMMSAYMTVLTRIMAPYPQKTFVFRTAAAF